VSSGSAREESTRGRCESVCGVNRELVVAACVWHMSEQKRNEKKKWREN
jgi:hypothetical protein